MCSQARHLRTLTNSAFPSRCLNVPLGKLYDEQNPVMDLPPIQWVEEILQAASHNQTQQLGLA